MKYFTLQACIHSETAVVRGIDNTPTPDVEAHIVESVETLLDPLCEAWEARCNKKGWKNTHIRIVSGYRSAALIRAEGDSSTSAHGYGYAFDLVPANGQMQEFKHFCRDFVSGRAFDQLISEGENESGIPRWMHVGYKHPDGHQQRRQLLSTVHNKYYPMTE